MGLIGWRDPGSLPICEDREIRLAMSDYSTAESDSAPDSPTERGRGERRRGERRRGWRAGGKQRPSCSKFMDKSEIQETLKD